MNYRQIATLGSDGFIDYLLDKINIEFDFETDSTSLEGAHYISNKMLSISNVYMELSSLLAVLRVEKRNVSRIGTKEEWQDYVDKESALEDVLKGLDTKYKALNKALAIRETYVKEMFMIGS